VIEQENLLDHFRSISKSEEEYIERTENIKQLVSIAEESTDMDDFLQRSALGTRENNGGLEGVAISTVHGVKAWSSRRSFCTMLLMAFSLTVCP